MLSTDHPNHQCHQVILFRGGPPQPRTSGFCAISRPPVGTHHLRSRRSSGANQPSTSSF